VKKNVGGFSVFVQGFVLLVTSALEWMTVMRMKRLHKGRSMRLWYVGVHVVLAAFPIPRWIGSFLVQLRGGDVDVQYAPVLPFLTAPIRGDVRAQFKLPGGLTRDESAPRKTLGARRRKKPTPPTPFRPHAIEVVDDGAELLLEEAQPVAEPLELALPVAEATPAFEPLVLWTPPEDMEGAGEPITVDPCVCKFLREHQREGLQFLFDCVHGLKPHGGSGCILADDMGLGKVRRASVSQCAFSPHASTDSVWFSPASADAPVYSTAADGAQAGHDAGSAHCAKSDCSLPYQSRLKLG
jgi:hypothetical protein